MLLLQLAVHLSPILLHLCFLIICSHFCFMDFIYYLRTFLAFCLPPSCSPTCMPLFIPQNGNVDFITIIFDQTSHLWEMRPFLISKPDPGLLAAVTQEADTQPPTIKGTSPSETLMAPLQGVRHWWQTHRTRSLTKVCKCWFLLLGEDCRC